MIKKRKKKIIVWTIIFLVLLLVIAERSWHLYRKYAIGSVGKNIMREIDSHADANGDCTLDLKEITDFEWDTLVVFDADFAVYHGDYKSNHDVAGEKMSQILGTAYERPSGYRALLIFLKNGEIVHEESYLADIEAPSKMNITIPPEYSYQGFDACCILSVDEASIAASCDGTHYYLYF